MKHTYARNYFRRVLIPIFYGCDSTLVLRIGEAIAGGRATTLVGVVGIEPGDSLSTGASRAQQLRRTLHEIAKQKVVQARTSYRKTDQYTNRFPSRLRTRTSVVVSHSPWQDLQRVIQEEEADLLVLDWPCHFGMLETPPHDVLRDLPCDLALVRGPIKEPLRRVLVPIRGGPHAELALRISLAISRSQGAQSTSLHILPGDPQARSDAPYHGISRVLENIPELKKLEMVSDHPQETILCIAADYDMVVMGASARPLSEIYGLGKVVESLLDESPTGMVVVKTRRTMEPDPEDEATGSQAISVLVDRWFAENTYNADEFADLRELIRLKERRNLSISLALPALNEAITVGTVIQTLKGELMDKAPLLDEIVLLDSNSTDETRAIAADLGVPVYIHQEVLPQFGSRSGKGEALWKSLYVTRGDIVLWIDTDIVNIHPRFIYGLIGPLLMNPKIEFVKAFYRRPIRVGERVLAGGGGRVTELTARPLINLFFPELSGLIQPLSGEYGGRRSLLERLPFFSGYGVEIGLLIDVLKRSGLDSIAQVDLQERVHHNQPLEALSKMSFAIIQAVQRKLEVYSGYSALEDVNLTMKLIRYETGRLYLDVEEIAELGRPPMADLPEYRQVQGL
jgi:glucosyl-3-phosphoglycerate synthase